MKHFEILYPTTLDEATLLLREHGQEARILAGGTELLVNMRRGLCSPEFLVSMKRIPELNHKMSDGNFVKVGGLFILHDLEGLKTKTEESIDILSQSAGSVGSVQIRNQGTIGGNICQEPRCIYYNHSNFWRESIKACLRRGGDRCYVLPGSKKCVAGYYSDMAPALIALDSKIVMVDIQSLKESVIGIEDFLEKKKAMDEFAIVKEIRIPIPGKRSTGLYIRYSRRKTVGFQIMSAAIFLKFEDAKSQIKDARFVIGGLPNFPKRIFKAENKLKEANLNEKLIADIAQLIPEEIVLFSDPFLSKENKKAIITVLVRRGLEHISQCRLRNK